MKIEDKSCKACGGKGIAQLGIMPSVILSPEEEGRWFFAEACVHCGAVSEAEENSRLVETQVRSYINFLVENGIAERGEFDNLI